MKVDPGLCSVEGRKRLESQERCGSPRSIRAHEPIWVWDARAEKMGMYYNKLVLFL
jgi:hypothetical protein